MSESKIQFSKDNIDGYLKALGKEYRKRAGKGMKAELILVGGAAILVNYGFRDTTTDVDALIQAASSMKDAINHVGDTFGLPNGWLNEDFAQTVSFSPKLVEYSTHYRTYANVLEVRTIAAEYLIAMKLRSGRQYKNDLSDVLGILAEHEKRNQPISMEQIQKAAVHLYGAWDALPPASIEFIENAMRTGQFEKQYAEVAAYEQASLEVLVRFDATYPGGVNEANTDQILKLLQERKGLQEHQL